MTLLLRMQSCPTGVVAETREVSHARFSIGRGDGSDWTLPDPARLLSKRHCEIAAVDGQWLVTDISSNGTFLNGACLEPGVPRVLRAGDRLAIGAYEFEADLDVDPASGETAAPSGFGHPSAPADSRLTGDPFPFLDAGPVQAAIPPVGLPADFDPLVDDSSPYGDAVPDHASDLREHFRPPRPSLETIPDDWDRSMVLRRDPPPLSESIALLIPPEAVAAPPNSAASLASFAVGAGISNVASGDPDTILRELGAAFRAMVGGLRRMMIARAAIKGEFRIEQTVIRAIGNNPLKFSADDDSALAALVGIGRKGRMTPEQAIAEALRDMRLHELAVASAMQHAVRDVLGELDPARLSDASTRTLIDRLSGRRDRASWAAYKSRHARIMRALTDDFDSVFGKSFVRAYEAAMAEIAAQDAAKHDREDRS